MSRKNVIAGRYEVVSHIGQGGMADVFLAVDNILNRQVAIKILRSDMSSDEKSILRFEREAQASAALAHPNIVEIYDVGEYKNHYYIVMEYLQGKTLKQIVRARGPLFNDEAVDIMKQLVSAVAEAHSKGIIHRDLKPQNVVVKADGSVKILDFGIATAKGAMQLTQTNNVMGSVHYLAPELAKGKPASPQSDIYALGIIFYEILAGDVPFKAEQAVQVALAHLREAMPSIREKNPTLPQSVENVITRATAKNPEERYKNCAEMYADIATCLSPERLNEPAVVTAAPEEPKPAKEKPAEVQEEAKPERKGSGKKQGTKTKSKARTKAKKEKTTLIKNKKLMKMLSGIIGGVAVAAVLATLIFTGTISFGGKIVNVPDIAGMTLAEAKQTVLDSGLKFNGEGVTYILTDDVEKGRIVYVQPETGTEVEKGAPITVTVSSGIGISMENFIGMNINDAQNRISSSPEKYELLKVNIEEEESDAPAGTVIRQEKLEPGDKFNPEVASQVTLVYSSYPTITIPEDIIDMDINTAVDRLQNMGVMVRTSNRDTTQMSQEELDHLKVGVVIECNPAAGTSYTQKGSNYITLYFY